MRLFWLFVVSLLIACGFSSAFAQEKSRQSIDREFHERLEALARKCDELGLSKAAEATRQRILEPDPRRQYFFVPGYPTRSDSTAMGNADLLIKWQAKFLEHRREHAKQLFELAQKEAAEGSATVAYQLLHEVLHDDPGHTQARRILQLGTDDEVRPKSRAPRIVHAELGWQRGRWWQIESPHFQIATDHSPEAGLELASRLEEFHAVWRQMFFDYWNTAESLRARFANQPFRYPSEAKHQIVLFRHREEYIERLQEIEPQIDLTLGYYSKGNRRSYFYHGDKSLLPVWYHEATHQLFQETGNAVNHVGDKWNFWLVEGVAVYMESLTARNSYFTVGGFDADRLQFLRSRVMAGEAQMPVAELARLGREDLQRHADIRRIYTFAAGLVHFLMDASGGQSRQPFIQFLIAVYVGQDKPDSWSEIDSLSAATFEQDLKEFLIVRAADLRFLGPAARRRNLSLVKSEISDDSLKALSGSESLEWLDLSLTPVTASGLRACGLLKNLKRISLVGTKINDDVAPVLVDLPQLEELDLSGTAVTDECCRAVSQLRRLKILRLASTGITDAGAKQLGSLKNLEELDLENTSVTAQTIEQLKQQLPNLQ